MNTTLARILDTFDAAHAEDFDRGYLRALDDDAFKMTRAGYPWKSTPPGYGAEDDPTK